jgi:hypothetical protein
MLSGMRNQIGELVCQRCGVTPHQGRGLDDLPSPERNAAAECMPRSLEQAELKRAFEASIRALVDEIKNGDGEAGARLIGALTGLLA